MPAVSLKAIISEAFRNFVDDDAELDLECFKRSMAQLGSFTDEISAQLFQAADDGSGHIDIDAFLEVLSETEYRSVKDKIMSSQHPNLETLSAQGEHKASTDTRRKVNDKLGGIKEMMDRMKADIARLESELESKSQQLKDRELQHVGEVKFRAALQAENAALKASGAEMSDQIVKLEKELAASLEELRRKELDPEKVVLRERVAWLEEALRMKVDEIKWKDEKLIAAEHREEATRLHADQVRMQQKTAERRARLAAECQEQLSGFRGFERAQGSRSSCFPPRSEGGIHIQQHNHVHREYGDQAAYRAAEWNARCLHASRGRNDSSKTMAYSTSSYPYDV